MFGITKKKTLWFGGMFALITPQMKSLEEGYKYLGSESTFVVLRVLSAAVTSQPGVHKD